MSCRRPAVRGATVEQNQTARRVVDYLHQKILENPERYQRYRHEEVAATLGIDPKRVRLALAHAGSDLLTVEVSAKDRAAIEKLTKKAADSATRWSKRQLTKATSQGVGDSRRHRRVLE